MTARQLYDTDPDAATDLWNEAYRVGLHHVAFQRANREFWGGFAIGLVVALGVLAIRVTLL